MPVYWVDVLRVGGSYQAGPIAGVQETAPVALQKKVGQDEGNFRRVSLKQYREQQAATQRKPVRRAAQLMKTSVVTLGPEDSIDRAREIFERVHFRHLPIVDGGRRLVGILSDRDVLRGQPNAMRRKHGPQKKISKVGDLMSTKLLTASPDTHIREIARALVQERIGALPIIGEARQLEGIISSTDILSSLLNEAPIDLWI